METVSLGVSCKDFLKRVSSNLRSRGLEPVKLPHGR